MPASMPPMTQAPTAPSGAAGSGPTHPTIPPFVTPPQCTPQVPLATQCAACICTATADCAAAVTECDAQCWGLLRCAYSACGTPSEPQCVVANCGDYLPSVSRATAAAACVKMCGMPCYQDLLPVASDSDAGI